MSSRAAAAESFASLLALRAVHAELLKRHRAEGETAELMVAVTQFLARARASGAILAEEEERWTAQSLIDYWNTTLYRAGTPTFSLALADFDPAQAPALPDSACPYLGLNAFGEANAAIFFGRRRVVAQLLDRLRDQRLLAVVGPSGSGKSSLVRAGLLPALHADGVVGSAGWQILPPMVPGSDPSTALDRAIAAAGTSLSPRLLIIDQFEEAFTLCTDEARRAEFLARVVALATGAGANRVVLTMRSDFEPFIAVNYSCQVGVFPV
jgi:hypothetical protein